MVRVLVPIDFSPLSSRLADYSVHFAGMMEATVVFIHVIDSTLPSADGMWLDSMEASFSAASQRLSNFVRAEIGESGPPVEEVVTFGVPGFTIADYATDRQFDYILCGMRNRHGVLERWLGTTSYTIVKEAMCPVIVIHEQTLWQTPEKMLVACESAVDIQQALPALIAFNQPFHAHTDFVHIADPSQEKEEVVSVADIREFLSNYPVLFQNQLHTYTSRDVPVAVVDTAVATKADVLVVIHRKRSSWSWLTHQSTSLKIAESWHLPVLVLQVPER